MTEEPDQTPPDADAPTADAPGSSEPDAAGDFEATRGASAEDAPTPEAPDAAASDGESGEPVVDDETTTAPAGDELADVVGDAAETDDEPAAETDDEPVAETGTDAPRRPRRPRRRRGAEAQEAVEETPAAPAPSRRRSRRDPDEAAPVVRAQAKYVRSSARKARLVCDHIRGKSVEEARAILAVTPRAIARDWSKLLESAVANAEHNHELVGEDLYIKAVHADEGPTIKRFRPRAMGRATKIRKRTSHLTILLTPKD